jgi:hypothetical protein
MRLRLSDARTANLELTKRDAEYITQDARYWSFFFKMTTTAVTEKGRKTMKGDALYLALGIIIGQLAVLIWLVNKAWR